MTLQHNMTFDAIYNILYYSLQILDIKKEFNW